MRRNLFLFYFSIFLLTSFAVLRGFFQYTTSNVNIPVYKLEENVDDKKKPLVAAHKCDPIISGSDPQYYVNLDGRLYPALVPFYLNKSINFACLNKQAKLKRILAWNQFVGNYGYGITGFLILVLLDIITI